MDALKTRVYTQMQTEGQSCVLEREKTTFVISDFVNVAQATVI